MSSRVLIVGAGAAAGAVARALSSKDATITVLDVGERLAATHEEAKGRLSARPVRQWDRSDLELITLQPEIKTNGAKGLPEKRAFGSDFPFRNVGQRDGVNGGLDVNSALVSGAYGGFTNVWGAQLMPFSRATFGAWPVSYDEMSVHYQAVLDQMPYAGEQDDLAELFPLITESQPLPPVSERTRLVLERYERKRDRLHASGVTLGRARLALNSRECVRCGLCMTGCPYSLIYSASHTLDELRASERITYHDGLLVEHVAEVGDEVVVSARELKTGRMQSFTADRVFVACGAIGSTRLAIGSLGLYDDPVQVSESVQFMLPFVSQKAIEDPRGKPDFTLNQFNMVLDLGNGRDLSQLHFYNYNSAFPSNLPGVLRHDSVERVRAAVLKRLTVALGYLPSWASPTFRLVARKSADGLPAIELGAQPGGYARNAFLRQVLGKVAKAAPALDLWPAIPSIAMSAPGKSYHWGATFPHSATPRATPWHSDVLGRVGPWSRVHLVDAAVFPDVPATTFTLTIMANAHRIATEASREL